MGSAEIGVIEETSVKTYEVSQIEWQLSDFSSIIQTKDCVPYESPEFIFNGHPWRIRLWINWMGHENLGLYLKSVRDRKFSIEYNLGLKKLGGRVEQLTTGIIKGDDMAGDAYILKLFSSSCTYRKYDQVPQNALTIVCALKRTITYSTSSDETPPLKLKRLDKLSENFKDLLGNEETCDTTLKVQDKDYKVHRSVLIARSSVFAATFKHDTLERQTGIISIPDCDPDSFQEFLQYLYCGELADLSLPSAMNLYYTSEKYDVPELKTFCVEYLMRCLTVENLCEVAIFADKYDEIKLLSAVQDFFNKNVCKIFETSEWEGFMKKDNRLANKLLKEMSKVKLKK